MHNSQCGACQAVPVSSEHNPKGCPPLHCLLSASCSQSGQATWYSHHVVGQYRRVTSCTPGEARRVISPAKRDRCVYRHTVCWPACFKGPAVPVNTAELWGLCTRSGQVQVSWDVFMWVSMGGIELCFCACIPVFESISTSWDHVGLGDQRLVKCRV